MSCCWWKIQWWAKYIRLYCAVIERDALCKRQLRVGGCEMKINYELYWRIAASVHNRYSATVGTDRMQSLVDYKQMTAGVFYEADSADSVLPLQLAMCLIAGCTRI